MTRIQRFPEEVLHIIFDKLNRFDIQQCQSVCQSWYFPAHVLLLQDIKLGSAAEFKRFAESIHHNPNTYYLTAIQNITLGTPVSLSNRDINEIIKQLFELIIRFPKLKSVVIRGSNQPDLPVQLKDISHDALAKSCPKLERFDIDANFDNPEDYFDLLYKLRHSLTFMRLETYRQPNNGVEYMANFPHLQTTQGVIDYSIEFDRFLPLVEKLPALKDITFEHDPDVNRFAEEYLSTKSKSEEELLVERLKKVTTFDTESTHFCVNAVSFIRQYLTGLKDLSLTSSIISEWNEREYNVFCELLQYARTLEKCHICINELTFEGLLMCLEPAILMIQTYKTDKLKHTHLELELSNDQYSSTEESDGDLEIRLTQDRDTIKLDVCIKIYGSATPQNVMDLFDSVPVMDHIDMFTFSIGFFSRTNLEKFDSGYSNTFEGIIRRMSSLKKLVMEIPTVFGEQLNVDYTSVTSLTLRQINTLTGDVLKKYIALFPKLEDLQLCYCSGVWQEDLFEFQINLGFCDLQKLTVDLSPVSRQMKDCNINAFIVIDVKSFSDSKRRLYRTPTNLLGATEINDASLEGLTLGKDYIIVRVTVNNLKCFDIFTYRYRHGTLYYFNLYHDRRESDDLRHVNLFNDKAVQIL